MAATNHKRDDNPLFDKPLIAFPAHWAPLLMALYDGNSFPSTTVAACSSRFMARGIAPLARKRAIKLSTFRLMIRACHR